VFALCLLAAAAHQATATNFGGSPIVSYGQRFRLYSAYVDAFCRPDCTITGCLVTCDVSVANMAQAPYFAMGGSCGRVMSSQITLASLIEFAGGKSCETTMPPPTGSLANFRCNKPICASTAERLNIFNAVEPAGGWLRGNDSIIYIREQKADPDNSWCLGNPSPLGMACIYQFSTIAGFKFVVD
jgi:hypothetical protein